MAVSRKSYVTKAFVFFFLLSFFFGTAHAQDASPSMASDLSQSSDSNEFITELTEFRMAQLVEIIVHQEFARENDGLLRGMVEQQNKPWYRRDPGKDGFVRLLLTFVLGGLYFQTSSDSYAHLIFGIGAATSGAVSGTFWFRQFFPSLHMRQSVAKDAEIKAIFNLFSSDSDALVSEFAKRSFDSKSFSEAMKQVNEWQKALDADFETRRSKIDAGTREYFLLTAAYHRAKTRLYQAVHGLLMITESSKVSVEELRSCADAVRSIDTTHKAENMERL